MHAMPLVLTLAGTLLVAPFDAAHASLEQTSFIGVVTANNPFVNTPLIGTVITGSYTIDPTILGGEGANCGATAQCWSGPDTSWQWNGFTVTGANAGVAQSYSIRYTQQDSAPGAGADQLTVNLGGLGFLTTVTLTFTDPTGGAFEGLAGSSFTQKEFRYQPLCVTGIGCATNPSYSGTITSTVTTPVPEPTRLALMLTGSLALLALRRGRRRAD